MDNDENRNVILIKLGYWNEIEDKKNGLIF